MAITGLLRYAYHDVTRHGAEERAEAISGDDVHVVG
jgi:hypothetical protein